MKSRIYEKLDYWEYCYNVPKGHINVMFMKLHKLLGVTSFSYNDKKENIAQIEIKEYLKDYPFAYISVLWHEFCHAEVWVRDGHTYSHSTAWVKHMLRKPWYVIGCVYAQIICIGK